MTQDLKKRLGALRGVSPRINAVANQTNDVVKLVEKTLAEDLNLGVSASVWFESEFGGERGLTCEYHLVFGRVKVSEKYRIHILAETRRHTPETAGVAASSEVLEESQILWPSCGRELKLKAFGHLPSLLHELAGKAEKLVEASEKTTVQIQEMVFGFDEREEADPSIRCFLDPDPSSDAVLRAGRIRVGPFLEDFFPVKGRGLVFFHVGEGDPREQEAGGDDLIRLNCYIEPAEAKRLALDILTKAV